MKEYKVNRGYGRHAWFRVDKEEFEGERERWGALCLTVCDAALDRFAVIMAAAADL